MYGTVVVNATQPYITSIPSIRTAKKGAKCMIYIVIVVDLTARAGKLYMGESENMWNEF